MEKSYFMGRDGFQWFIGVVEDRNDPEQIGRVRVRCLGYHTEDVVALPTVDLPFAHVMHPVTDPSMQGIGTTPSWLTPDPWVVGFWRDNEFQQPLIIGITRPHHKKFKLHLVSTTLVLMHLHNKTI